MSRIRQKLDELGIVIPQVAAPAGSYLPAITHGNVVYTSGQLPFRDGELAATGKVGAEVTLEQAQELAQLAALNCLAAVKQQLGAIDRVTRILKVTVYVNSAAGFVQQPQVANGASDFFGAIFGDAGRHVRSAVGVAELPLDSPVEIEIAVAFE
ncbi:RidA family protein [Gulosibacter bifidus]|uniref:RidA family protein n=1 Tax=Gulosibacter bifidus TaxID=272239 RepID=A0ABW5RKN9_9MICO|nr:RidA family protein [Gulosibacter bifidus]